MEKLKIEFGGEDFIFAVALVGGIWEHNWWPFFLLCLAVILLKSSDSK